jgi:hypothetical protein
MRATKGFSNQHGSYKLLLGSVQRVPGVLRKAICSFHTSLKEPLHTIARGFGKICENHEAFKNKLYH